MRPLPSHSTRPSHHHRLTRILALIALLFVRAATAAKGAPAPESASAPTAAHSPDSPPNFPDAAHVPNGCVISALVYAAKFSAAFPGETARLVQIKSPRFGGPHTVVLLTWNGRWWGRDEHFGLFALNQKYLSAPNPARTASHVRDALERHVSTRISDVETIIGPSAMAAATRPTTAAVNLASRLLPYPARAFSVTTPNGEVPLLYFRPSAGLVAVYDPQIGTALAECVTDDADLIVLGVAERLGHRVLGIRTVELEPAILAAAR